MVLIVSPVRTILVPLVNVKALKPETWIHSSVVCHLDFTFCKIFCSYDGKIAKLKKKKNVRACCNDTGYKSVINNTMMRRINAFTDLSWLLCNWGSEMDAGTATYRDLEEAVGVKSGFFTEQIAQVLHGCHRSELISSHQSLPTWNDLKCQYWCQKDNFSLMFFNLWAGVQSFRCHSRSYVTR